MSDINEQLMRLLEASGGKTGNSIHITVHIDRVDKIINMPSGSERRFIMSELDLNQTSEATAYFIQVVVPYAVGKMADGSLGAMGKDVYESVQCKAGELWEWVKGRFKDDPRLQETAARVEKTPADSPEFAKHVDYLHSDLANWLKHNPQALKELTPLLEQLRQQLPNPTAGHSGDQTIKNVSGSSITQIGDGSHGNTVIH